MTIHAVNYNMQVENVIVEYKDRPEGSVSKLNTFRDGMRVIWKMMQLYKNYKPLSCFGLMALLLILVAFVLFIPILLEYMETGLVPKIPTLIVCGFLVMAAVEAFFSGMVLDVQVAKDRKDFEYRLNKIYSEKQLKVTTEFQNDMNEKS